MSLFISLLLFLNPQIADQNESKSDIKILLNELITTAEQAPGFPRMRAFLSSAYYRPGLIAVGRYDDAIDECKSMLIDSKTLNKICLDLAKNGRENVVEELYAAQASFAAGGKKRFAKNLIPGLMCGQLLRAVEAGEFEIAISLIGELDRGKRIRNIDEVFRELTVHSIDHGLIDQAVSFVKRAKSKTDVANAALRFADRNRDDSVFEFLRKLRRIDSELAIAVAIRFIESNSDVNDFSEVTIAQIKRRQATALNFIRDIERDLGEMKDVKVRVSLLKSQDIDDKEKNRIVSELETFLLNAPREKVEKHWYRLSDAFSLMDRLDLLEKMAGDSNPDLASTPIHAIIGQLIEKGQIREAKSWLNSPKLKASTSEDFLRLATYAVKCEEFDLIDNYIRRVLESFLKGSNNELKEAPYTAEKLLRAALVPRETNRRTAQHILPLQLKILEFIGESDFSDPQPLLLFLDEFGSLASEHYWLKVALKRYFTSQAFADFFIPHPQGVKYLLAIGDRIPASLIDEKDQRVFRMKIKRMIARSLRDSGRLTQCTDFVITNFHSNRDITTAFSLDWKDSPPAILKFVYERAPDLPENIMYGVQWHKAENRPDKAFELVEQFVSLMLKDKLNDSKIDLMYQTVELFAVDWFEKLQPKLESAGNKESRSTLASLMFNRMVKIRASDQLLRTSAHIESSEKRLLYLLEAVDRLTPLPASRLERCFHQIKNPRPRKHTPTVKRKQNR